MRGGAALRGAPQQQLWADGRCPRCLLRSRASWLTTAPLQLLTRSAQGRSQRGAAGAHLEMFPRVSPAWSGVGARLGGLGARGGCSVLVAASVIYWLTRRAGWGAGGGRRWRLLGSLNDSASTPGARDGGKAEKKAAGVPASEWENLSDEERRAWRELREAQKLASKEKLATAINTSSTHEWKGAELEIVFDLSYGASSTDKMNRSLAKQLAYAYSYAKNTSAAIAPAMHITSYAGEARQALENRGAGSWLMHKHEGRLREVFAQRMQDLVYLSPDGQETLQRLTPGKVYVIGGIVDRSVSKGLSLEESRGRAPEDFAIPAMRLPIDEHIPRSFQGRGHILNINTVAHILMAFQECGDWEEAIVQVMYAEAPARFRQSIQPERRALVDGSRPPPKVPLNTRNTRCFRPLLRDHVSGTACSCLCLRAPA